MGPQILGAGFRFSPPFCKNQAISSLVPEDTDILIKAVSESQNMENLVIGWDCRTLRMRAAVKEVGCDVVISQSSLLIELRECASFRRTTLSVAAK